MACLWELQTVPVPDLQGSVFKVNLEPFMVEGIDDHRRGVSAAFLASFQYHVKLEDHSPLWRRVWVFPECEEMVDSYRAAVLSSIQRRSTLPGSALARPTLKTETLRILLS